MATAEIPEEGEQVIATVQSLKNFGAFVTLDEYEGKEAFIHLSEVATGWVKYIRDHIREGQKIVGVVIHVDHEKGHVDLSLKRVNEHQRRERLLRWKNEKRAQKLLTQVAKSMENGLEDVRVIGERLGDRYGSLYKAFEMASVEPERFAKEAGNEAWVPHFTKVAKENISTPHVAVSGILEVSHPAPDGVLHVQKALLEAEKVAPGSITVQYVGAPRYRLTVSGFQYKNSEELLKRASDATLSAIKKAGGKGAFAHK